MVEPVREALEALRGGDVGCPRSLRERAVEAVRIVSGADTALFYTCADATLAQPVVRYVPAGACARVEGAFADEMETVALLNQSERDLRSVPQAERLRFHRLHDLPVRYRERFEATEHYRRVWDGAAVNDMVRVLAYDSDDWFVGWIGGVRTRGSRRFAARDRQRAQRILPAVRDALVTAARLERAHQPDGAGLLVATLTGEVELCSDTARAWLDVPGFREEVRAVVQGTRPLADAATTRIASARARVYRLAGGESERIAIHLDPLRPIALSSVAALTSTQRTVAEYAAAGATAREIASTLELSPHTVRDHLKRAYRTLGVASRVELAEALRAGEDAQR